MSILAINAIRSPDERRRFDDVVLPRLGTPASAGFEVRHLMGDPFPDGIEGFTHLLISGSELSAAERNPRDDELMDLIRAFVQSGRPVFGICYGHQMVARALAGDHVCRRAAVPEFGWKRLSWVPNALFNGLSGHIVPIHSHYDEVFGLGDDFKILASTDHCSVQAMQYRDLPVWGVQFHPELGHEGGQRMLRQNLESEPAARELAADDLESVEQAESNLLMLKNFFNAERAQVAA